MRLYLVGGAIRDIAMGRVPKDEDFVYTGVTPEFMEDIEMRPVGRGFPVYIQPSTGNEFALACRDARMTDFDPTTTIEEDLYRRDFTMNAMARRVNHLEEQPIIDPYGGLQDIQDKVIRHVNPLVFVADPIRILRMARLYARYSDFTIAPETIELAKEAITGRLLEDLVPERVWSELSRGLMEDHPSRMIELLHELGALKVILPEVDALWGVPAGPIKHHPEVDAGVHTLLSLQYAADAGYSLRARFAALVHDVGKALTPMDKWPSHPGHEGAGVPIVKRICKRLKVPNGVTYVATVVTRFHLCIHGVKQLSPKTVLKVLCGSFAKRSEKLFKDVMDACVADARGRTGFENCPYPQYEIWYGYRDCLINIDVSAIAEECKDRVDLIKIRVHNKTISELKRFKNQNIKEQA